MGFHYRTSLVRVIWSPAFMSAMGYGLSRLVTMSILPTSFSSCAALASSVMALADGLEPFAVGSGLVVAGAMGVAAGG